MKGIVLEEIESRSQILCPLIQIDWKEKAFLARAQHSLAPKFIKRFLPPSVKNVSISPDEPLDGTLQIEGNWKEKFAYQVQGSWKECLFKFKDKPYLFTQLNGRYRDGSLLLGGKTSIGQIQTTASLQIDNKKETLGVFKLQESAQDVGISLFFRLQANGAFEPSHIAGEFSGIKTQLRKKAGAGIHLLGTTEVDFTKVRQLFPRDTAPPWQGLLLGKGFTIEGDLVIQNEQFGFKGEVRGDNCELLGCQIQKLSSVMTWMPQRLRLEKLQVTDPALTLAIRSLALEETAAGKIWTLNCPFAQVREFQPSRLRKIGKPPASSKPFVIRNLTFLDIMGDLGNPKTFSGECALHFTNSAKKEESILDVPLEFLKDVGLDPSVLVPIQGELEGHFENGRLLFTALKSSYSEGRRTQFFLSERGDGSYIDLQGNMHIDLSVKQAVVLKLAESLRLGIRGSVAKPLLHPSPVKALYQAVQGLFFPPLCLSCDGLMPAPRPLFCADCLTAMQRLDPNERCTHCFHLLEESGPTCPECKSACTRLRIGAVFNYDSPASVLIKQLKYGAREELAPLMASWMIVQLRDLDFPWPDALVSVPQSLPRRLVRGYNPSSQLAAALSQATWCAPFCKLLEK